jgi:hypothetical protein
MYSKEEIGWHGIVERDGNVFKITDILVYPQKVTGATVTTDQVPYQEWLMAQPVNKIRFQGHSHVNMGCSPSGVDEKCKEGVLESVKQDDYYLFMIWNKSLEFTGELFDATSWIKYQTRDMEVSVEGVGPIEEYIKGVKSLVKTYTYSSYSYGGSSNANTSTVKTGTTTSQNKSGTTAASKSEPKLTEIPAKSNSEKSWWEDEEWYNKYYNSKRQENTKK